MKIQNLLEKTLVEFIRFNQRLSEEQGNQFDLGSSLFQSLQLLAENEIALLICYRIWITVDEWEIDEAFYLKLGFIIISIWNQRR